MIVLFTDFGVAGPYVGQVKAVLARKVPGVPVIDLMHDAPAFNPRASSYLLAALCREFEAGSVFVCVVDPGVGTSRRPLIAKIDGRWFVGPDNGLLNVPALHAKDAQWWEIHWLPPNLSDTFHGRDLFAPVAAHLVRGEPPPAEHCAAPSMRPDEWPVDLAEVIYVDAYGNATTGLRAAAVPAGATIEANGQRFVPARTFGDAAPGSAIWYVNSNGLVELAINLGSAGARCTLAVGTALRVTGSAG